MDSTQSILRSARSFFAGTLLSRFSGLLRDIAMASCFGASPEIAAFMVSYRLANLFRRLLGEGNLQAGFVPHFEQMKVESLEKAASFYRDVNYSLGLILLAVIALLEIILWICLQYVGPDWQEIVELSMWMVPGLFFICLYALSASLLQCQKKYFIPAVAPVVFNLVWIGAVLFLWQIPKADAVRYLSIAVTLAFGGQWMATALKAGRLLPKSEGKLELFSPEWKALLKPLSLGIIGIGAVQLNSALDAVFARIADPEAPAFLWYAVRIQQLPLALFGISLSGALLPPLSRAVQSGEMERYHVLLQTAFRQSAALMIICTFGIFALGRVGVNFLYGHGDFSPEDVRQTMHCLWGYGLGLIPSVFVLILASGFYAQKNYRVPTVASLVTVIANICFNALLVFGLELGAVSIAVSTSLSAILNFLLLSRGLRVMNKSLALFVLKMGVCCGVPSLLLWIAPMELYPRSFGVQVIQLGLSTALYLVGIAGIAWKMDLFSDILSLLQLRKAPSFAKN